MTQICNSCWLACVQSQPLCILLCSPYRLYANLWKEHNLDYLKKKFSWMKKGENTFCKRKCYLFKGILASPSFIFIAKKSMFFIRICGFHRTSPILRTAKCGASEFIVSNFVRLNQFVHYISDLNFQMTKKFQCTFEPYIQWSLGQSKR